MPPLKAKSIFKHQAATAPATVRPVKTPKTFFQHLISVIDPLAGSVLSRYSYARLLAGVLLTLFLVPPSAPAYVIEPGDDDDVTGQIVISPAKGELDVDAGDSVARKVTVINRTGGLLTIEFAVEDFEGSLDPSEAMVFLDDEDSAWGARNWLEPEVDSIVLDHGESITFDVDVNVPLDAEPGGHYAVVFASSTVESVDEEGAAVETAIREDCLFLITVSGDIIEDGAVDPPEVPLFSEYGPIAIGLVFNNYGNVHLEPAGRVVIKNFYGRTVAEIPVESWVILPESSRRDIVQWDSNYLLGRYTATVELGYGSGDSPASAHSSFWVIPWKLVLGGLLILLVTAILLAWLYRRSARGRQARRQAEPDIQQADEEAAIPAPPDNYIPLNVLFPSMADTQLVDTADEETRKLIRDLIISEIDMARSYQQQGMIDEARLGLEEARAAAQLVGLLSEVGMIDDILRSL